MKKIIAEDILKYFNNEIKKESFIPNIKFDIDKSQIDIIYPLIGKLAYAHIYYDNVSEELVYELLEPEISDEERILIEKVKQYILDEMYKDPEEFLNKNKEYVLIKKLEEFVNKYKIKIDRDLFIKYYYYLWRDMLGYEKIHPLFYDIFIEDISCDGYDIPIYVHHNKFGILKTNIILSRDELDKFIVKLAQKAGKHISYVEPILDATLPDGSRVNATYSQEITTHGPTFTIRKFREIPWTPIELIRLGSATPEIFAYLWLAVEFRKNIIIIGGTASGKTTMLNAISMFIPPSARIVSIEDTREIRLYHSNWIPSVVKYSSDKNREIDMFELLRMSFRQRPDYVIVGEVRGEEAYVMFQGMASGHSSLSTMHAENTRALISRLTTPPINLSPTLIELLNVVVIMQHDNFLGTNLRRVKEINEIVKYNKFNIAYKWNPFKREYLENPKKYLFRLIENEYGIKYKELYEEYLTRAKLLYRLSELNISDFQTFSKIVQMYYYNKENILKYYNIE